jgi:hypothetical protein
MAKSPGRSGRLVSLWLAAGRSHAHWLAAGRSHLARVQSLGVESALQTRSRYLQRRAPGSWSLAVSLAMANPKRVSLRTDLPLGRMAHTASASLGQMPMDRRQNIGNCTPRDRTLGRRIRQATWDPRGACSVPGSKDTRTRVLVLGRLHRAMPFPHHWLYFPHIRVGWLLADRPLAVWCDAVSVSVPCACVAAGRHARTKANYAA